VRNVALHATLEAFTIDAASRLANATADGEEIPFEVVGTNARRRGARVPLYCYRPLTGDFIGQRIGLLSALSSYAPAARLLAPLEGTGAYLRQRGETGVPGDARERANAALRCFLARVFEERSAFAFDAERFGLAYQELERTLYEGRCVTIVMAPLHGVALDPQTTELVLDDSLSLVRGDALHGAPPEAVWGHAFELPGEEPCVLAVLRVTLERAAPAPVSVARARFRRTLTALRLFEHGSYALGPLAWTRVDDGAWRAVPLGASGRSRLAIRIAAAQEDELRAFCSLVGRRMPSASARSRSPTGAEQPQPDTSGAGELAWALSRFEMGCERLAKFEALTDYLLALRALLEPEGPATGRLAQRLAAICAQPADRAALAARTAHVISLERALVAGLAPAQPGVDALVDEIAEHLRAILRDILCGHLDVDVRTVADELLAEAALARSGA
jgi:hypothetical protein